MNYEAFEMVRLASNPRLKGRIMDTDPDDAELPYLVAWDNDKHTWMAAEELMPV